MAAVAREPLNQEQVNTARASFKQPELMAHVAGAIMALCGGMINTISFLELGEHSFVSHLTGTSTKIGIRAAGLQTEPSESQKAAGAEEAATALFAVLLVTTFVIGSAISGVLISRTSMNIGRSAYGLVLFLSSGCLCAAAFTDVSAGRPIGALLVSVACGIQNGMVSTYSGNIIRTTHVTGTWTDFGLSLGRIARNFLGHGIKPLENSAARAWLIADMKRARLMLLLALAFIFGCYLGALLSWEKQGLLIPAAILALGGLAHSSYVAFVLNISFFQMVKTSGEHERQVSLLVDGAVYDLEDSVVSEVLAGSWLDRLQKERNQAA